MKKTLFLLGLCVCTLAQAELKPEPVMPQQLQWQPAPIPGVQAAWVLGRQAQPGDYLLRVKLAAGTLIPPHTHPDARMTTVLSGAVQVGFGADVDRSAMVTVPAGGVYQIPAGVPHYIGSQHGAVYQEAGVGPTATRMIH